MGLLDSFRNKDLETELTALESGDSRSSTLVPAEPPVVQRLRKAIDYVVKSMPNNGATWAPIVKRVTADMVENMEEFPPEIIEFYTQQVAGLLYWTATGKGITGVPLPDDFGVSTE